MNDNIRNISLVLLALAVVLTFISFASVSYTHLDVYKRQGKDRDVSIACKVARTADTVHHLRTADMS